MAISKDELELAIKAVETSIARIDTWVLVFGSFVAIGIAGETILGIAHWINDRQLRNLRHVESQMHESEIIGLQGGISSAKASADQLKVSLDNATAQAKLQAEELKRQNLKTESDLLIANQKLEDERLARVKIEEKMKDRHLTVDQQQAVAAKLKRFAGQRLDVYVYSGDSEITGIARDILGALSGQNSAGWAVMATHEQPTRPIPGILVEFRGQGKVAPDVASALVSALKDERLDISGPHHVGSLEGHVTIGGGPDMKNDAPIAMTIGKKP